ncbi:MAG: GDSL-type esterase/lipase family protein [Salibacteraceae bacterium]|nr:GDSL-type esterase/lipase family protein [Salibacteraceae bacterium]
MKLKAVILKTILFPFTLLSVHAAMAQTDSADPNQEYQSVADSAEAVKYPFVHYDLNHFTANEKSASFKHYYQNFDHMMRYGIGKMNMIHFGGSHIQADIWSNLLRERLQTIDTNIQGARGILFPFKAAGTNRPYSYSVAYTGLWQGQRSSHNKHEGTWGVSGITATTSDAKATMKFTFHESPIPVKTKSFTLLSNIEQNDYELEVITRDGNYVNVFADANGYTRVEYGNEVDSIELIFTKSPNSTDELQFYGLISDNERPGITYHSIGVNGSRFISFQRCELFEKQLPYLKPDLVILSIGTNDSSEPDYDSTSYKNNFRSFLEQIRSVNPNCAIMLTVPNDNYVARKYHNDNLASVRNVIYELAAEFDAKVWDLYGIMGGKASAKTWKEAGMMKSDLVHFTKDGYLLKGDLFYQAFLEDYLKWYNNQQPIWTE